jgi:hypothetical protein
MSRRRIGDRLVHTVYKSIDGMLKFEDGIDYIGNCDLVPTVESYENRTCNVIPSHVLSTDFETC